MDPRSLYIDWELGVFRDFVKLEGILVLDIAISKFTQATSICYISAGREKQTHDSRCLVGSERQLLFDLYELLQIKEKKVKTLENL